jgi:signal transduction histidine kinase
LSVLAGSPITVLVVDDNPDHLVLAERALKEAGFEARTAASGEEALISLDGVDLVLMDYGLPKMSGIEVLAAIRRLGGPPVVMVTGHGSEEVAVEALRGGAIDYIPKSTGYLADLPRAVARAWRTHDLALRAGELERLALLVTSARDRIQIFGEIARGARTLLRADTCWVLAVRDQGLEPEGVDGTEPLGPAGWSAAADALHRDSGSTDEAVPPTQRLVVPLRDRVAGALGALVVITRTPRQYLPEEISLARTFASFAATSLANLTRFELERSLAHELQAMLDMRSQLVSSVSHELRTPLTSISGFAATLMEQWQALTEEQRMSFVGKIHRHAGDLADVVDGLLDHATVEAGKTRMNIQTLDLPDCVGSTLEALGPLLAERPVDVEVPEFAVQADAALCRRILTNLLSNAVKYSPAGAPIRIRATRLGRMCRVEVADRGPGMTGPEVDHAFEPFWRGTGVSGVRGAGIGLSLVREYSRLMGGGYGVDSEPGRGSTFFFSLPLAEAAEVAS